MMRLRTTPLALAALAAVAGCDDTGTLPEVETVRLNADVAEVVADAALEDLAVMNDLVLGPAMGPRGGPFGMPGGLGSRAGLEKDRTVTFFDTDGAEQEAFDALTTASVRIVTTVEGEIERDAFSASVERRRDLTVTGLAGEETERTWNGTGSSEVSRTRVTDDAGTRSYDMESSAEIEDVVRAVDRVAQPWPLSGSITRHVEVVVVNGPNGDVSFERTTVLTFNGTQFATLEVDGESYEVDLAARAQDRASRRKGGQP